MAHPSTNYIKYLIAKSWPGGETAETVNECLDDFRLLKIEPAAFDAILASVTPPKTFNPRNRKHSTTKKFMRAEKIYGLWDPKPEERAVLDLLPQVKLRETIQLLLMGKIDAEEISHRINKKHGTSIKPKTIETYRHYFWNVDRCSLEEWAILLFRHPLRDHYLSSYWGSKNQALFRAGFSPTIDGRKALREAYRNLYMRLEASRIMPDTKDTARIVAGLSKELVTVHHALFGEGAGVEEAMKELRAFKMERQRGAKILPIRKLAAGGSFSGEGKKDD